MCTLMKSDSTSKLRSKFFVRKLQCLVFGELILLAISLNGMSYLFLKDYSLGSQLTFLRIMFLLTRADLGRIFFDFSVHILLEELLYFIFKFFFMSWFPLKSAHASSSSLVVFLLDDLAFLKRRLTFTLICSASVLVTLLMAIVCSIWYLFWCKRGLKSFAQFFSSAAFRGRLDFLLLVTG